MPFLCNIVDFFSIFSLFFSKCICIKMLIKMLWSKHVSISVTENLYIMMHNALALSCWLIVNIYILLLKKWSKAVQ